MDKVSAGGLGRSCPALTAHRWQSRPSQPFVRTRSEAMAEGAMCRKRGANRLTALADPLTAGMSSQAPRGRRGLRAGRPNSGTGPELGPRSWRHTARSSACGLPRATRGGTETNTAPGPRSRPGDSAAGCVLVPCVHSVAFRECLALGERSLPMGGGCPLPVRAVGRPVLVPGARGAGKRFSEDSAGRGAAQEGRVPERTADCQGASPVGQLFLVCWSRWRQPSLGSVSRADERSPPSL